MFRITTENARTGTRHRVEGRLRGPWVTELEALFLAHKSSGAADVFTVNIDGVTDTDQAGRFLLALIQIDGGTVTYSGPRPAHLLWEGGDSSQPKGAR